MKIIRCLVAISTLLPTMLYAQTASPEQIIKRIVESGVYDGHDVKVLGPMGDAAAVILTKVLGGRHIEEREIFSSLTVLETAFGDPRFVQYVPDREPRTALLLLEYFSLSTSDAQVKKSISETEGHLMDRYKRALANP